MWVRLALQEAATVMDVCLQSPAYGISKVTALCPGTYAFDGSAIYWEANHDWPNPASAKRVVEVIDQAATQSVDTDIHKTDQWHLGKGFQCLA